MTEREKWALDEAVRRYPWRKWRRGEFDLRDLMPDLIAEYRRILAKEADNGSERPAGGRDI